MLLYFNTNGKAPSAERDAQLLESLATRLAILRHTPECQIKALLWWECPVYQYRNLKRPIDPGVELLPYGFIFTSGCWAVTGHDRLGRPDAHRPAYVLEWCKSESDAKSLLAIMKTFFQFKNLAVEVIEEP